jgi:hypothetical protein
VAAIAAGWQEEKMACICVYYCCCSLPAVSECEAYVGNLINCTVVFEGAQIEFLEPTEVSRILRIEEGTVKEVVR